MSGFICSSASKNCENLIDSYGEICVGCNCCGRIDKNTVGDAIIATNSRHILDFAERLNNADNNYEDYQKRNCAKSIINFAEEIIKATSNKALKGGAE